MKSSTIFLMPWGNLLKFDMLIQCRTEEKEL